MTWALVVLIMVDSDNETPILLSSATQEKQGMGEGVIEDQEHLALVPSGSRTKMHTLSQRVSVQSLSRMSSGMPGSGDPAEHCPCFWSFTCQKNPQQS